MAKYLRRQLEPRLEEAAPMVRVQRDLRGELKRTVEGSEKRRERLWAVIESETVWEALAAGENERARRLAREQAGLRAGDE
jgi:siroheme synthase (precorrin-2 oxidase/ferrochelatase)